MEVIEKAVVLLRHGGYDQSGILGAEEGMDRKDDVDWVLPRERAKGEAGRDVGVAHQHWQVLFKDLPIASVSLTLLFCRLITFVKSSQHWTYSS